MIIKFKLTIALNLMCKRTKNNNSWFTLKMCLQPRFAGKDFTVLSNSLFMHQSIPAAPSPHPPSGLWPLGISIFLPWMANFRGGDYRPVKSPGVGTKKEGKSPVHRQHCNIFHWLHSRIVPFKHFNVRFFVLSNVFLCNSARIRIKTSPRDDMHQFMVLVLI